jgi:hypothetical protein
VTEIVPFDRRKEYVDSEGVRWRRRGDTAIVGAALGKRLRKADMRVVHHYLGKFTEIPPEQRAQFWESALTRMAESVHSEFIGSEFKDSVGRRLLVLDENC